MKVGEWMQWKSFRQSCNTRCLITPSTTSTPFRWRSFTGSRVVMPFGLASAKRRSSWVAVEIAWPGGSSLGRDVYLLSVTQFNKCQNNRDDYIHTWSVAAVFYCSCRWFSLEWPWGFWLRWQRCPATSISAPYDCRVLHTRSHCNDTLTTKEAVEVGVTSIVRVCSPSGINSEVL